MQNAKMLDLIRDGQIPIVIRADGLPDIVAGEPYYELMQAVRALAAGYMRLFNDNKVKTRLLAAADHKGKEERK